MRVSTRWVLMLCSSVLLVAFGATADPLGAQPGRAVVGPEAAGSAARPSITDGAELYLSPPASVVSAGSEFTVDIHVNVVGHLTNAVAAHLVYPNDALTFETVTVNSATWGVQAVATGGGGVVGVEVGSFTSVSGDKLVATVKFKAIQNASVTFDEALSGVVDSPSNTYLPLSTHGAVFTNEAPSVTGLAPGTGLAGDQVVISGTGFVAPSTVTFGGVAATQVSFVSAHQIKATVPPGSGTVDVVTANINGPIPSSTVRRFTYTGAYTTSYTAAEQPRVLKSAAYMGQTPEDAQKSGVFVIIYILNTTHPRPAPMTLVPPPSSSGPVSYTSTWNASDISFLREVQTQYSLTPEQAQKWGMQVLSYVLIAGGH